MGSSNMVTWVWEQPTDKKVNCSWLEARKTSLIKEMKEYNFGMKRFELTTQPLSTQEWDNTSKWMRIRKNLKY